MRVFIFEILPYNTGGKLSLEFKFCCFATGESLNLDSVTVEKFVKILRLAEFEFSEVADSKFDFQWKLSSCRIMRVSISKILTGCAHISWQLWMVKTSSLNAG